MRKGILILVGLVIGLSALTFGLYYLHTMTRERLLDSDRSRIAFADIDCLPPASYERPDFLAEVQYLAHLPDQVSLLDDELTQRLADGFAKHPWVDRVERVEIVGLRHLHVSLKHRIPVLQVVRTGEAKPITYLLDSNGVLLSQSRTLAHVPAWTDATLPAPTLGAGSVWSHPNLDRVVRTAALVQAHQDRLKIASLEISGDRIELVTAGGSRVKWGGAPGMETTEEARAEQKVARLLEYCRRHGDLDQPEGPIEHDVRGLERASHRTMASRIR